MKVYVKSKAGNWIMPTHAAKARFLLKQGNAKVIKRTPFAIQITYDSPEITQPITVGIDDGGKQVGVAVVSDDRVLYQEEVTLRTDIKAKMDTRRSYRCGRRFRKTRYRAARFLNRVKKQALAPSIKSKKDAIFQTIRRLPLPVPSLIRLEDAYFDFQAMENPNISGEQYQHGPLLYQKNFKTAAKVRDDHKCRVCRVETNLQVHHIKPRSEGGTDKLSNLMTICEGCHQQHHHDGLKLPKQKNSFYKFAAHVQQGKNYLRAQLEQIAPVRTTFGYVTAYFRKQSGIEKSHVNDAVVITAKNAVPMQGFLKTKCLEYRKRSIHEANPRRGTKTQNIHQIRRSKNTFRKGHVCRLDTVHVAGNVGYVKSFNGSGCCVVGSNDKYIIPAGMKGPFMSLKYVHRLQSNQQRVTLWIAA